MPANNPLPWVQYTEPVVGKNHPTLTDTINRSLRQMLTSTGLTPDNPFYGLPVGTSTYNAASFPGATKEGQITSAIAQAVTDGVKYVYVPQSMLPYNASLVTFNTNVIMLREGGNQVVFDVKAWGAAGNGTTDDTIAIQAVLTAVGGGFQVVYFPPGTYLISGTLTVVASSVGTTLAGAGFIGGPGVSVIRTNHATADILSATNCQLLSIIGLQFESRITRTGGRGIVFNNCDSTVIGYCRFIDCFNTIDILSGSSNGHIHDCYIAVGTNVTNRGIFIQNSLVFFLRDCIFLLGGGSYGSTNASIQLDTGTDGVSIVGCQSAPVPNPGTGAGRGLWLTNTLAGTPPVYTRCINFYIEGGRNVALNNGANGIQIDAARDFRFTNGYVVSSLIGIQVAGGTDIRFTNTVCFNNLQHGVSISGGDEISFNQCDVTDNSIQTNATYSHIAIAAGTNLAVDNCAFGNFINGNTNTVANGIGLFNNSQGARLTHNSLDQSKMTTPINDSTGTAYKRGNRFNLTSPGAIQGIATLVAGTVTVSTTEVQAGDRVLVNRYGTGGTIGHLAIGAITGGTSFVINSSSAGDTSTVLWEIVH